MARRRGPQIRVRGVNEEDLRLAVVEACHERRRGGRAPSPEDIDRYLENERHEIYAALEDARGTEARFATYRRLMPGRSQPVGRFPSRRIGAVAVVASYQPGVTHSSVVARCEPPPTDPGWTEEILEKIRQNANVTGIEVRVGQDYGTIVARIHVESPTAFRAQFGSIQASLRNLPHDDGA
jgi:hypothetical protein